MNVSFSDFGWLFIQSALLLMQYGYDLNMPEWVVWFPTLFLAIVICIALIIIFIVLIVEALR